MLSLKLEVKSMCDSKINKNSRVSHQGNKIINVLIYVIMVVVIQVPVGLSLVALPLSLRLNDWYTITMSMFILGITLLIIWG